MTKLQRQFSVATTTLAATPAATDVALGAINQINSLGTPSFASKHLRFLRPDVCPVLDIIMSRRAGYSFTLQGYKAFSDDCLAIARILSSSAPPTIDGASALACWRAADVEMAVFAFLQGW